MPDCTFIREDAGLRFYFSFRVTRFEPELFPIPVLTPIPRANEHTSHTIVSSILAPHSTGTPPPSLYSWRRVATLPLHKRATMKALMTSPRTTNAVRFFPIGMPRKPWVFLICYIQFELWQWRLESVNVSCRLWAYDYKWSHFVFQLRRF